MLVHSFLLRNGHILQTPKQLNKNKYFFRKKEPFWRHTLYEKHSLSRESIPRLWLPRFGWVNSFLVSVVAFSFETVTVRESGALKSDLSAEFPMDSCKTLLYQETNKLRWKKIQANQKSNYYNKKKSFSLFKAKPVKWCSAQSHHPMNLPYQAY